MWRIALVLALIFAPAAAAQDADPQAAPASLGLELLAQSQADGVFELLPTERIMAFRHVNSGLVCRLDPEWTNQLVIFPQAARGEDVACVSGDGHERVTVYATRFSTETNLQEQLDLVSAAARRANVSANPLPAPASETSDGLPASGSLRFALTAGPGEPNFSRYTLALVDGWVIKVRYNTVASDAAARQNAERRADAIWRGVMTEFMASHTR